MYDPVRSKVRALLRLCNVAMRCAIVTLLAFDAPGSFAKDRGVSSPAPEPTIVSGTLPDLHLPLGTDKRVCVHTLYSNGAEGMDCRDLKWSITNPDPSRLVASIDEHGMVFGLSVGQATFAVTYLGHTLSARCTVTAAAVKKLQISWAYPTIDEGSKETFVVTADFERGGWQEVVHGVRWTVADVAPATQVAVIDQSGQAKGLHSGMAEIKATWMGHTASTMLSVVPPSSAAPEPVKIPGLRPKTWRRMCIARLRHIWLPRLRALPDATVELRSIGDRSFGVITVAARQGALERKISIRWNPDECDAAGPTSSWAPTGFDWRSPSTLLEHILAAAGYDCLGYIP